MTADPAAPLFGAACALGSALAWTLISLVARALSPYFNALSVNMLRSATGGALLVVVVLVSGGLATLRGVTLEAWGLLAVSVITAFALGDTVFFESTKTLGLARAMTVSMVYPLVASVLGLWVFGERITPAVAGGAVVTLGGVALIVSEHGAAARGPEARAARARGLALALLAALSWAVSAILMKAPLSEVDPVSVQAVRLPLAALVLWLTPWARGAGRQVRAHLRAVGPLLVALAGLTALSSVLFVAGLKYASIAVATVLSATSPLFALPIGLLALGERVTWRAVGGVALCLAGIALLSL